MDDKPADSAEDSRSLLELLEDALPVKREVKIEGWPLQRSLWMWRLDLPQLLELNRKRRLLGEGDTGKAEWGIELLVASLGDETAPGAFASARGRSWLRRQAEAVIMLIPIVMQFNELDEPHPDRKKKSGTTNESSPSSPSASELE